MKYLLLSLLLYIPLFADEKTDVKLRASNYLNNYSFVKFMINNPMIGNEEATSTKLNVDYIRNIKIKGDNKLLYNVNISPYIAGNPLLKFSYQNIKPLSLTLEYTNNEGVTKERTVKIRHREESAKIPKSLKLSSNVKSYPTQIKSIQKLFGNITLIPDGIQLTAPKIAENGRSIPINIRSDIRFKSISLFVKKHGNLIGNNVFNLATQWFSTPYSIADFSARINMFQTSKGEVLIVLAAKNGKFYTIKKEVEIAVGGLGG